MSRTAEARGSTLLGHFRSERLHNCTLPRFGGAGEGGKCDFSSLTCTEPVLAWLSGERGRAQARASAILRLFGPDKLLSCAPPRVGRGGHATSAGECLGF